jgi:hypothetical protein
MQFYNLNPVDNFNPVAYAIAIFGPSHELIVGVHPDGSVEFGDGYNGDTASTVFWHKLAEKIRFDEKFRLDWESRDESSRSPDTL